MTKIIIFDDPLSSLDYSRKSATINQLYFLSKKVNQLFVLTHDINFAKDLNKKFLNNKQILKIIFRNGTSEFVPYNIEQETLTGIFKDLTTLHSFLDCGVVTDFDRREVIRCIRPVIEGIFRIKFFKEIKPNEWLGNFIDKIRNSKSGDKFHHLLQYIDELSDINDYSKEYHHSNPSYMEIPINDSELRQYVHRTLNLIVHL